MQPLGPALTLERPASAPERPGENPEVAYIRSAARLLHSKFSDPNVLCPALAFLLERDNPHYGLHLITEDVHAAAPTLGLSLNNVLVIDVRKQIRVYVDLEWAPRFQLYHSTPKYAAFHRQLPPFFVGTEDVLEISVRDICGQMEESMAAFGMPLPPWRTEAVIMHSYRELASAALGVLPLGAEEESPAISSIEEERPQFDGSPPEAVECRTPPLPIDVASLTPTPEALPPHQLAAHPPEAAPLPDGSPVPSPSPSPSPAGAELVGSPRRHAFQFPVPVPGPPDCPAEAWTHGSPKSETADPHCLMPPSAPQSAGTGWASCPHLGCWPRLPSEVRSVVDTVPTRRFCPASPGGESVDSTISFSFEKDLSYQAHSCPSTPISTLATQLQGCPLRNYHPPPPEWPDPNAPEPRARPPIVVLTSYPPFALLH